MVDERVVDDTVGVKLRSGDSDIELLGTRGCHLCDQAEAMLRVAASTAGVKWVYTDITEDDVLLSLYAERIPVLRACKAELGWPFGVLDILRLIRGETD